jgi:hypothetical protein
MSDPGEHVFILLVQSRDMQRSFRQLVARLELLLFLMRKWIGVVTQASSYTYWVMIVDL